jgi:hypothetical protein
MFVNKDGYLTISPELQTDLFFNKNNVTTFRGNENG